MKKSIFSIFIILITVAELLVFSGCKDKNTGNITYYSDGGNSQGKQEKVYGKSVQKYSLHNDNQKGTVRFEFVDDKKYDVEKKDGILIIKNKENFSEIQLELLYDSIYSTKITKEERDFYSYSMHDYQKVTVGNYKGWSIYNSTMQYEINLVLTEPEKQNNRVYAIDIKVKKSPDMSSNMVFEVKDFVESDDFQYMLNSINFSTEQ